MDGAQSQDESRRFKTVGHNVKFHPRKIEAKAALQLARVSKHQRLRPAFAGEHHDRGDFEWIEDEKQAAPALARR